MSLLEPFVAGFVVGVANAAHCAGMCGVFALRVSRPGLAAGTWSFSSYAVGKALTYVSLGAIAGTIGGQALAAFRGAQAWVGLAAGVVLLVAGWRMLRPRGPAGGVGAFLFGPVSGLATWAKEQGSPFLTGAATGLLPCGVVYLAALQSAAWGGAVAGSVSMAGFGLGTVPVLAVVALAGRGALARFGPARLRTVGAALVLLAGVVACWRAVPGVLSGGEASCCH